MSELIGKIKKKRLVFTVTTGRSGTAYLSSIFGFARDTHSYHEPEPEFADILRQVQEGTVNPGDFWVNKKLPAIAGDQAPIYVETSHLACKGFLEPLLELGVLPDLVIHRRPARDIALSMLKMGTIPGKSPKGLRFYLSPDDPGVLEIDNWRELEDYQICFWYCLEIERRARYYKTIFSEQGARVVETTLSGLKTFSGLEACFSGLNLTFKYPSFLTRLRFRKSSGVKVNESKETKKAVLIPENLMKLESEVFERISHQDVKSWLVETGAFSNG
jgi:hypothetical protein